MVSLPKSTHGILALLSTFPTPNSVGLYIRRRTLKSTLHPTIFWEMVKFVDLGVLYFSLVLPRQSMWTAEALSGL